MSLSTPVTPIRSSNPFEAAKQVLIHKLQVLKPPKLSVFPNPAEFDDTRDFLRELAEAFDEMIAAVGHQVADNSSARVDMGLFLSPVMDAISGNALYEIEMQKEALIEEHNDMLRSA